MKTFSMRPASDERQRPVACVVCGRSESRPHWQCDGFYFVHCTSCGHVYQNPQPIPDDLALRYDSEYFDYELENAEPFYELMRLGLEDVGFMDMQQQLRRRGQFLDIGCATGVLLQRMQQYGWDVQGVEICEPAARYAIEERGVPVHLGPVEGAPFERGAFAAVHTSHVIEHVPDPRDFLRRIHDLLCPGGVVVIVTPDRSGVQARLFGSRWRSAIADHLNLFSSSQLRRLLQETGFEVLRKRSWGGLTAGAAPRLIKRPADRLAKLLNVGDVCAVLARKSNRKNRETGNRKVQNEAH